MKTRLVGAVLVSAFVATSSAQDQKPTDAPPAAPTVTPEAKAAFAKMDAAIDLPVAKGLRSMTGVVEGALKAGTVTVNFSFTAPSTFAAESSGKKEPGTSRLLELAVGGARFVAWADADAETAKKDGRDEVILTLHDKSGGTSRAHYELDGDGLPTSFELDWARSASGVASERSWTALFTWTKAGAKRRLATLAMTVGRKTPDAIAGSFSATFDYEEFDGIAVPTSWVVESKIDAADGPTQRIAYRFTELSINGARVELKAAKIKPAAAGAQGAIPSTPIPRYVPIGATGTYVHEGSGLAFPRSAAKFARIEANRYDVEGNDVGIGYRRIWGEVHVEVTLYVYPVKHGADGTPWPFDKQFDGEVGAIRDRHADVKEIRRADASATCAGKTVATRTAEFQLTGEGSFGERTVTSYLTAFRLDPWHVTYRVTATLEHRDEALAAIQDLLAELHLPSMGVTASKGAEKR